MVDWKDHDVDNDNDDNDTDCTDIQNDQTNQQSLYFDCQYLNRINSIPSSSLKKEYTTQPTYELSSN